MPSAAALRARRDVVPALLGAVAAALGRTAGAPNAVVLTAPSGGGKSHLLRELTRLLTMPVRTVAAGESGLLQPWATVGALLGADRPDRATLLLRVDELLAREPLVLVVDDLQSADAESLQFLLELLTLDAQVVLVAGSRPEPRRGPVERLLALDHSAEWVLPAFDLIDIDVLVRDCTGAWPGPQLRTVLQSASANALHLLTILDDLVAEGTVSGTDVLELTDGTRPAPPVTATVAAALSRLDDPALDVLRALAVLDHSAEVDQVARLLAVPTMSLLGPVQRVLDAGLLVADAERLAFAHDAYREAAYAAIPVPLRRAMHRAAAQASGPVQRARHVIAAQPATAEVMAAVRAAVDDLADAPGVAADLLAEASTTLAHDAVAAELAVARAQALARSGQLRLAGETATEALSWATDPVVVGGLRRVAIFTLAARGRVAESIALLDATLAAPLPDPVRQPLLEHRDFLQLFDGETVPLQPYAGDVRTLSFNGLVAETLRRYLIADTGVALEYAWAASRRSLTGGADPNDGISADVWPPFVALAHAGPDVARSALHEVIELREQRGADWQTAGHHGVGGAIELAAAQLADAAAHFDTALDLAARMELGTPAQALAARAVVEVLQGDPQAARRRIGGFAGREDFGMPLLDRARVAVLEAERRYADAARLAGAAWFRAGERHLFMWQALVAPEFARVAIRAADKDLIAALHTGLAELPRPAGVGEQGRRLAALLTGQDYRAVAESGPSIADEAIAVGNGLVALFALEEAAVAAAVAGDKDSARVLARRVIASAEEAGARAVSARVTGRLRALGVRLGSTATRSRPEFGWESLTPTERQVVGLVASGAGGPDIARRLHLSPRTVQTHVSHVLTKLGLSSRVELAAAAALRAAQV